MSKVEGGDILIGGDPASGALLLAIYMHEIEHSHVAQTMPALMSMLDKDLLTSTRKTTDLFFSLNSQSPDDKEAEEVFFYSFIAMSFSKTIKIYADLLECTNNVKIIGTVVFAFSRYFNEMLRSDLAQIDSEMTVLEE